MFYFSIALTVLGGVLYHVSQKATPRGVNPVPAIIVAYLVALGVSLVLLLLDPQRHATLASLRQMNWATVALGLAIVGVELGFLLAYRAGWSLNSAAVTSNVAVAVLVVPAGMLLFREPLLPRNLLGILFAVVGLLLLLHD